MAYYTDPSLTDFSRVTRRPPVTQEEELLLGQTILLQQVLDELRGMRRDISLGSAQRPDGNIELKEPDSGRAAVSSEPLRPVTVITGDTREGVLRKEQPVPVRKK